MYSSTCKLIDSLIEESNTERLCITSSKTSLRRELARLARSGELVSPWRGMYAGAEQWGDLKPLEQQRRVVRTLAKKHPDWVFCQLTAALMHGMEVSYRDLTPLHVAIGLDCHTKSNRKILRHPLEGEEVVTADGVRVTTLKRTALDCLIELDFRHGLAIADSALRIGKMKRTELIKYIKARADVLGWQSALDAAAWANPLAANGGESIARATMIEQGYVVPKLQVEVPNIVDGSGKYYADFYWELPDGTRVAGELDGLDKYYEPEMTGGRSAVRVMADERLRESRLGAAGLRVVRFSFADVEDGEKFSKLLSAYGIPRGEARYRGRRYGVSQGA